MCKVLKHIVKLNRVRLWEKLLQWQRDSPFPFKMNLTVYNLDRRFTKEN